MIDIDLSGSVYTALARDYRLRGEARRNGSSTAMSSNGCWGGSVEFPERFSWAGRRALHNW